MKFNFVIFSLALIFLVNYNSLAQLPDEFKIKNPPPIENRYNSNNISTNIDKLKPIPVLPTLPMIGETYIVNTPTLNIRDKPSSNSSVVGKLKQGDMVTLLSASDDKWWWVKKDLNIGYVSSEFLKGDYLSGWEKKNYTSGTTPECENVTPQHDFNLNNYLKINVGSSTDVVVKLMKIGAYGDECIRIVYIRGGDSYEIKNIAEGKYYVKLAFGKDYRKKIINNQCQVKFMSNPLYEKGEDILDYNKVNKPDEIIGDNVYKRWSVPSYTLNLDVISSFRNNTFDSNKISEKEFNQ